MSGYHNLKSEGLSKRRDTLGPAGCLPRNERCVCLPGERSEQA
jgi:hypothetical protein